MAGDVGKLVLCGFVTFEFMKDLFALIQKHFDAGFVKAAVILSAFYFLITGIVKLLAEIRDVYSTKSKLENAKAELELAKVQKELALLKGQLPTEQAEQVATTENKEKPAKPLSAKQGLAEQWPFLVVLACLTACGIVIYHARELSDAAAFLLVSAFFFPVIVIWNIIWEGYQAAPKDLPATPQEG